MIPEQHDDAEVVRVFAVQTSAEGIRPARVVVSEGSITVEIAGLSTVLPRATTHARRLPDNPTVGGPSQDAEDQTHWRYTTAGTGIVELTTTPPVDGWVSVLGAARRISVSCLRLSLVDADDFVAWLEGATKD